MSLSFESVFPDDDENKVRVATINGIPYLACRGLIMVVCRTDNKGASKIWERLDTTDLAAGVEIFQFEGRREKYQPVISFKGALCLLMKLPGEQAKAFRSKVAEIITRVMAGDTSLIREIEINGQSSDPISQMARDSLRNERGNGEVDEDEEERQIAKRRKILAIERREFEERRKLEDEISAAKIERMKKETIAEIQSKDMLAAAEMGRKHHLATTEAASLNIISEAIHKKNEALTKEIELIKAKHNARKTTNEQNSTAAEEAQKKKAEEEARKKKAMEEAAKKKAEEEAQKKKATEEAAKKKAMEEAAKKRAMEAIKEAEEAEKQAYEANKKAEEAKKKAEEAKKKAEEASKEACAAPSSYIAALSGKK